MKRASVVLAAPHGHDGEEPAEEDRAQLGQGERVLIRAGGGEGRVRR